MTRILDLSALYCLSHFVFVFVASMTAHSRSRCRCCSLIPNDLSTAQTLCDHLLSAVCVAFVVGVLSFRLLVTKEVAPPAFRVVHLSGRPGALHLPHLLKENNYS